MAHKLFVFDLDNTLRYCARDYAGPILDGTKRIIQALGPCAPHALTVIETYHVIDRARVDVINPDTGEPYKFTAARFPSSFIEAYRQLCEKLNTAPSKTVEIELYDIGMSAFDESLYNTDIAPGAKETLAFLRNQEDRIIIYTKGEGFVQERKIKALQKLEILTPEETVKIVPDKSSQDFAKFLSENLWYERYYAVGDAYDADIRLALEAGFDGGIFMPFENWDMLGKTDEVMSKVDHSKCMVVHSLPEIITRYAEL